jgi:arsenate reductase|nr:MAG: arsenate reductase (glutaredoxin) [Pseudomonadota bacterium]
MSNVTIYHNPACSNSRNTLALLRERGIEPTVIEYLKNPPDRATLRSLIERMGTGARSLLRAKGELYEQLGLADPELTDEQIIDAMLEHPVLINRPVVVTPKGVRLCRPPEKVLELL